MIKSMEPEEFHRLLRQAASKVRRHRPPWLDTQDLTQAAHLALLEAKAAGRDVESITDPAHLTNKTRQRLWGAMMDAIRNAWDGTRNNPQPPPEAMPEDSAGVPLDTTRAPDNPMRTVQLKQAVERFACKGSLKQQEAVLLTAAGYGDIEIAEIMGISATRVGQLKRESRDIMSMWGDV